MSVIRDTYCRQRGGECGCTRDCERPMPEGFIPTEPARPVRVPPKGPSGISPDPPTALTEAQFRELLQARLSGPSLDPIRAHALLCAATRLQGMTTMSGTVGAHLAAVAHDAEPYLRGQPTSTPVIPNTPGERCPSCDHLMTMHQPEGCWYTVSQGSVGHDLVCVCSRPNGGE